MVTRAYSCLNRNCRNEFNSEADHPPCPRCRGLRVQWLPKPFGINKGSASIDRTVRQLAEDYGMKDFRSPQRGQQVKIPTAVTANGRQAGTFEPQKGWRIPMPESALSGAGHAVCAPTGVTAKVSVAFDQKVAASKTLGAGSQIEGSYRPKGGVPT